MKDLHEYSWIKLISLNMMETFRLYFYDNNNLDVKY